VQPQGVTELESGGWRFKLGLAVFVLAFAIWLLLPMAAAMRASAGMIGALSGGLFVANKVLLLLVIAVMGKPGFLQLKLHVFGYAAMLAPPLAVGSVRYALGLVMFCAPLVASFSEPYVDLAWPGLWPDIWSFELLGDLIFIASFFVLGGDFWDKFRALFISSARGSAVGIAGT
jgi:hypothetical protein